MSGVIDGSCVQALTDFVISTQYRFPLACTTNAATKGHCLDAHESQFAYITAGKVGRTNSKTPHSRSRRPLSQLALVIYGLQRFTSVFSRRYRICFPILTLSVLLLPRFWLLPTIIFCRFKNYIYFFYYIITAEKEHFSPRTLNSDT